MGYLGNENTVTGTQNSKRIVLDATPNQTISTVTGGYTIGQLDVYLNGVKLAGTQDFTALDGSTVTFLSAVNSGDEIEYVVFENFDVANAVGTSGNQTIDGNLAVTQINVSSASTLGVSTATSIVVGSAVTANVAGVIATGIITATSFSGSGANLTGIDATTVKDSGGTTRVAGNTSGIEVTGVSTFSGDLTASTNVTVTKQTTTEHSRVTGIATINTVVVGTALTLADNVVSYWGTGGDLQIYHDGSHSQIKDAGSGGMHFWSGDYRWYNAAGSEYLVKATEDDAVELYYNGVLQTKTTSTGIHFADDKRIDFGTGSDLRIYHDGTHSYISDTGTGALKILSSNVAINSADDLEAVARFTDGGACELYYDNSKKIETTTSGVTVTGELTATSYVGNGSGLSGVGGEQDITSCLFT